MVFPSNVHQVFATDPIVRQRGALATDVQPAPLIVTNRGELEADDQTLLVRTNENSRESTKELSHLLLSGAEVVRNRIRCPDREAGSMRPVPQANAE